MLKEVEKMLEYRGWVIAREAHEGDSKALISLGGRMGEK